jgi:sugar O-acyltransferase (sialic acid O-acetyltransferase NeuD family)
MKKALIGNGGHAREVMSQIGEVLPCFVDDDFLTEDTLPLSKFDPKEFQIMVAISDCFVRNRIVKNLPKKTTFFTFVHPTSLICSQNVFIGDGSFIGAFSILTSNIRIGSHCILNRSNHIGHDSIIGDFFSAMPGSIISGNCLIGDKVFIGTNSSVKEKTKIVSDTIIGLNSGVVFNIEEPGIYGGVPAKKIIK